MNDRIRILTFLILNKMMYDLYCNIKYLFCCYFGLYRPNAYHITFCQKLLVDFIKSQLSNEQLCSNQLSIIKNNCPNYFFSPESNYRISKKVDR